MANFASLQVHLFAAATGCVTCQAPIFAMSGKSRLYNNGSNLRRSILPTSISSLCFLFASSVLPRCLLESSSDFEENRGAIEEDPRSQRGANEENSRTKCGPSQDFILSITSFRTNRHKDSKTPSHFSKTRQESTVDLLWLSLRKEFSHRISGSANLEDLSLAAADD